MPEDTLSLQDLADASGLEPRTIRSYIERSLLPGPDTLGRNATYGREHLARLKAIGILRDARRDLTLDQIRGLLAKLSPQQIQNMADGRIAPLPSVPDPVSPSSALKYLKSINAGSTRRPSASGPDALTPVERLLESLRRIAGDQSVPRSVRGEAWHRIPITPDIELSVRGDFGPDELARLNRIGDHLRHLLTKGASR